MNTYHYKGKVYDLTVDSAHSYNVNNLIVHNSGAGSLVNYALGITKVNPLDYDLIFER
jgi:DNA polymerase-3 subunit alpha